MLPFILYGWILRILTILIKDWICFAGRCSASTQIGYIWFLVQTNRRTLGNPSYLGSDFTRLTVASLFISIAEGIIESIILSEVLVV